jgi:hypothetical protein
MAEIREPATGFSYRSRQTLYHQDCGGVVAQHREWSTVYSCDHCNVPGWKPDILGRFSDEDMGLRFYTVTPEDPNTYKLVWTQDSFSRHTKIVKTQEAQQKGLEPVKF